MRHRLACVAALAATCLAVAAEATIKPTPVRLVHVGPAPVLRPGEPATLRLQFESRESVRLSHVSAASASLSKSVPAPRRDEVEVVAPGAPIAFDVAIEPDAAPEPLVVKWEVDGVPYERTIDLESRLETRIAERSAMIQVDRSPVPPDPRVMAKAESVLARAKAAGSTTTLIFYSGRLVYTRPAGNGQATMDMGAWGVRVSLMDEDTGPDDELGQTYTGPTGSFYAFAEWNGQIGEGDPELYIHFETDHPWVVVQEGFWDIEYSWSTSTRSSSTADLEIGTWRPSDSSTHPALHIANDIARNHEWYDTYPRNWFLPSVDVKWPEGSTGAYYDPTFGQIHIGTDRQWREDTHAHEYGHFFVDEFAAFSGPEYCNGICDEGSCGHCLWCPETNDGALTEGWPDWIAQVQTTSYAAAYGVPAVFTRDMESVSPCTLNGPAYFDPEKTEGIVGAILQDIWDSGPGTADADPNALGTGLTDVLELGDDEILAVMDLDQPTTSRGFLEAFRNRYPQYKQQLWITAMNSHWDIDQLAPGAPSGLTSSSHPLNTSTAKLNVSLSWTQAGPDDWSGVQGYSIRFGTTPAMPDLVIEAGPVGAYTSDDLAAGTWYATIRTVDRSGKGSSNYSTYGPFTVVTPTPVDIQPYLAGGWARPVVARATGDATASSVPNPTAQLPGNSAPTYFNASGRNAGQSAHVGVLGMRTNFFVDGSIVHITGYVHPDAPGATFTHLNRTSTVRGGRHMVGVIYDGFNEWFESNEVNNYWSHPWVWSPLTLAPNASLRRPMAPPNPVGSWSGVVDGSPLHYNCDGLRFNSGATWNAVWIAADADTDDYSIRLHSASGSVDSGFDTVLNQWNRNAGSVEAVFVNGRTTGAVNWDVGVVNDLLSETVALYQSGYVVRHATSASFAWSDTAALAFPDSEYVSLQEVYVPSAGIVAVTVWTDPAAGPIRATLFDRLYQRGALDFDTRTDASGELRLHFSATAPGYHCVALARDPRDGRTARAFTLGVGAPRPDLAGYQPSGWAGAVVPRPAPDAIVGSAPMPDTLHAAPGSTWISASYGNLSDGGGVAPSLAAQLRLDGMPLWTGAIPTLPAWTYNVLLNQGAFAIPPGRHLLSGAFDTADAEVEVFETNNAYGEQWTWAPAVLASGQSVGYVAAPEPTGGFEDFVGTGELFYNSHGLRTTVSPLNGDWAAIGVLPHDDADVDVRLHEPAPGARDAFGATLRSSSWGASASDYVLARARAVRTYDVSVVGGDEGGAGLFDATVTASGAPLAFGTTSATFPLGLPRMMGVHTVVLPGGDIVVRAIPTSGSVDLGLSVHGDSLELQSKSDAIAAAWLHGPGQLEELLVHVDQPDTFVVTVWKAGGGDFGLAGTYQLQVATAVLDGGADGPRATALAPAQPAPFRAHTTLAFTLAEAGDARLEAYDVRGARVRTLAAGRFAAGRHEVRWDGEGEHGRHLAPGVYLVRLQAGSVTAQRKVVKVE